MRKPTKQQMKKMTGGLALGAFMAGIGLHLAMSDLQGFDGPILAIVPLAEGGAIVGGDFSPGRLARVDANGARSDAFDDSWIAGGFNGAVRAAVADSQGGIVVGGDFTGFDTAIVGAIARLFPDGTADTAFLSAAGAGFDGPVRWLRLEADGKILVGGDFTSFDGTRTGPLARLLPSGALDADFSPPRQADGIIVTAEDGGGGSWVVGGRNPALDWLKRGR